MKSTALFVHFSSDQVYPGDGSLIWTEEDRTAPVNSYGRSKLAAEEFISENLENFLIFRSSLICGPSLTLKRELFLQVRDNVVSKLSAYSFPKTQIKQQQMLDDRLRQGPFPVFSDEWRSPIFVSDIVAVCTTVVENGNRFHYPYHVFNLGGPEGYVVLASVRRVLPRCLDYRRRISTRRLSKADLASRLAALRGYPRHNPVVVSRETIAREMQTPANLILNTARLTSVFPVQLTSVDDMLARIFV